MASNSYNNVKKFKFWCYKILPLTYDDSLSYYEVLCKVYAKLNECIDVVNDITGDEGLVTDVENLKTQVANMLTTLDTQLGLINDNADAITALQSSLADDIDGIKTRVAVNENDISALKSRQSELETLVNNVNDFVTNINIYIDDKINAVDLKYANITRQIYNTFNTLIWELQKDVEAIIKRLDEAGVDVYNYSANKRFTLDDNNTKLYIDLENAISAEEYCTLGLSADDYKTFDIQAIDYLRDSKKLLHYNWVYMPVSGFRQEISNALTEICDYIFGTMTDNEYDALSITADEYAGYGLTATNYLSWNPNKPLETGWIKVAETGMPLTSGEYNHMIITEEVNE